PFRGESSGIIFDSIMNRAPLPPLRLNPDLPAKLEDIISRALEKDRELRYQSAKEMRAELQRLKRDTETGRALAATSGRGSVVQESRRDKTGQATSAPSAKVAGVTSNSGDTMNTAEVSVGEKKGLWKIGLAAAFIGAAMIGGGLYYRSHARKALTDKDTLVLADFFQHDRRCDVRRHTQAGAFSATRTVTFPQHSF